MALDVSLMTPLWTTNELFSLAKGRSVVLQDCSLDITFRDLIFSKQLPQSLKVLSSLTGSWRFPNEENILQRFGRFYSMKEKFQKTKMIPAWLSLLDNWNFPCMVATFKEPLYSKMIEIHRKFENFIISKKLFQYVCHWNIHLC